ncbi:MAG: sigma-70 family RNA polymerase sigma factor [Rhodothermales bacterium]
MPTLLPLPMASADLDVTVLLAQASDADARNRLFEVVYDELHAMAHRHLGKEYQLQTLNTTALVHEAYFKMVDQDGVPDKNRAYFFGAAARAMRQVLVDHARRRQALKRGGDVDHTGLDNHDVAADAYAAELLGLNEALDQLATFDPRGAQIVELRFFGGLSVEETAKALEVSDRTVKRAWRDARLWLYSQLKEGSA